MLKKINARQKGVAYEIAIMNELKEFFPQCATSRNESKVMDDLKVDFVHTGDFHIQAKAVEGVVQYHTLLTEMPKGKNIIFHKKNRKGTVVVMTSDVFYLLLASYLKDKK